MAVTDLVSFVVLALILGLVIIGWFVVFGWWPDNSKELATRRRKQLVKDHTAFRQLSDEENELKRALIRKAYLHATRDIKRK